MSICGLRIFAEAINQSILFFRKPDKRFFHQEATEQELFADATSALTTKARIPIDEKCEKTYYVGIGVLVCVNCGYFNDLFWKF